MAEDFDSKMEVLAARIETKLAEFAADLAAQLGEMRSDDRQLGQQVLEMAKAIERHEREAALLTKDVVANRKDIDAAHTTLRTLKAVWVMVTALAGLALTILSVATFGAP